MDEMTWPQAIQKILAETTKPLHYTEITERIIAAGLRKSLGATPSATVNANLANSIKNDPKTPYVRVDKGVFALAKSPFPNLNMPLSNLIPTAPDSEDKPEQYHVVTSFGMFWRRDAIDWTSTPKLLGFQEEEATPVDFSRQFGIYLLYDGREAIYIGRATDQPLGRRLYQHTKQRLSTRWDRFSWFGLLPVKDTTGELKELPDTYDAKMIIPALEAVLIEAFEPRQNRKQGDDLSEAEYFQYADPLIQKKKMKAMLDQL